MTEADLQNIVIHGLRPKTFRLQNNSSGENIIRHGKCATWVKLIKAGELGKLYGVRQHF